MFIDQSRRKSTMINLLRPETAGWGGGLPRIKAGTEKVVCFLLRWAKSRESYRRIASESYRCDSNH